MDHWLFRLRLFHSLKLTDIAFFYLRPGSWDTEAKFFYISGMQIRGVADIGDKFSPVSATPALIC
jgi:hypothetical protein